MVIIYLAATLLLQSCCLPFGIGRAALKRRYTWHYSTQGLPNLSITAKTRELLPHVFNLTFYVILRQAPYDIKDGNFLWPFLFSASGEPAINRCVALYCPDFPSSLRLDDNPADRKQR